MAEFRGLVPKDSVTELPMGQSDNMDTSSEVMALTESSGDEALMQVNNIVTYVKEEFNRAKDKRRSDEIRWLKAYRNFRGLYGPDVQFTDTEKSQAFLRITKMKVLASHAHLTDILFSGAKFPIGVEPSPIVENVAEAVHFDPKEKKKPEDPNQTKQPAKSPRIGNVVRQDILKMLGPYEEQLDRIKDDLKEGYGTTPTSHTFEPAIMAAKNMEKQIHDQLEESDTTKHLRLMVHDLCLFGTGVFKGPFAKDKEYPKWDEDGSYRPVFKPVADVGYVSVWDAYPDPDARTMEECEKFIQRHRMSRTQLRALKGRPYFRQESIEEAIKNGYNYINEYWEDDLKDFEDTPAGGIDRFEVLEYWGLLDKEIAEDAKIEIPEELEDQDQIQCNIWTCGNQVLRVVLNPFKPARIPYYITPYEVNPYSIFGIGVAENMEDLQESMNGFWRMAIDNAAISSNVVFEIDETNLVPGQDMKIYPGKIFRRQAGAPGQAIFSTKFQNVSNEIFMLFDKARQLSDEVTGLPSYSHGMANVQNTGKTASGMSMLMGAADRNIKSVVRNIDDYLLSPLGKSMFAFNMQFNFDKKMIGDLEIVARGTEALMRNEVRAQKLQQFAQITANPMDAPFVKRDYILRELSASLDLDPDKTVNDPREAAIQAHEIQKLNQAMGVQPDQAAQGSGTNASGAPSPNDPTGTGGGNIAPGNAPPPGAPGNTDPTQGGPPSGP